MRVRDASQSHRLSPIVARTRRAMDVMVAASVRRPDWVRKALAPDRSVRLHGDSAAHRGS
jgi:hypothetical protein